MSRADIAHRTAKARKPIDLWGELPLEILDGTRRANYAPPLPAKSYAHEIAADRLDGADEK